MARAPLAGSGCAAQRRGRDPAPTAMRSVSPRVPVAGGSYTPFMTVATDRRSGDHLAAADPGPPTAVAHWFGDPGRPLLGWLSTPERGLTSSGVLILPAIGYSYWSSHQTVRALAERLAGAGHTVLRFDYHGTGDSSGDQWEIDRLDAWRASATAAAAELRRLGCRSLALVGVRLGATLALLDGAALGAEAVIAWEPVTAGRRHVREIRMLAMAVPAGDGRGGEEEGTLVSGGVVFTPQTLDDLAKLDLDRIVERPAPRALVVSAAAGEPELIARLRALGCAAEHRLANGEEALDAPAEAATIPTGVLEAAAGWLGRHDGPADAAAIDRRVRATIPSPGGGLTEEVVRLGRSRMVGVVTTGAKGEGSTSTVVFLSSGSETHIGPGRAWVEYARALADAGHCAVRVDFRGWGESPDDGFAPGRPYDAHCEGDTVEIVRALRERGHQRIALFGLCAGAWVALRVALHEPVEAVIAVNPQFYWRPGHPVFARNADSLAQRAPARRRESLGHRPWPARWLDELVAAGVPVSLLFAGRDEGLVFLENRVRRRLDAAVRSGVVRVADLPGIDHAMHRAWLRDGVVEAIRTALDATAGY